MATKQRWCWACGDDMGLIPDRLYSARDVCGKLECNKAARDAEREERDEAHRDLDERMGW